MPERSQSADDDVSLGASGDFSHIGAAKGVEHLAVEQGVGPVLDPRELRGDFWPEDENLDDFLGALRSWRREGRDTA